MSCFSFGLSRNLRLNVAVPMLIAYLSCQPVIAITIIPSVETTVMTKETKAVPPNVLQEMDITFWQTLPFATFWTYLAERQISGYMTPGMETNWQIIFPVSAAISFGNAWVHSQKETRR